MTDKVLIINNKTGSYEIKQIGYFLPVYDLGDIVGYKVGEHQDESAIIGINADIKILNGEVITAVIYELEDGTEVMEEEVEYYYCDNEGVEDIPEETVILDERDQIPETD